MPKVVCIWGLLFLLLLEGVHEAMNTKKLHFPPFFGGRTDPAPSSSFLTGKGSLKWKGHHPPRLCADFFLRTTNPSSSSSPPPTYTSSFPTKPKRGQNAFHNCTYIRLKKSFGWDYVTCFFFVSASCLCLSFVGSCRSLVGLDVKLCRSK